MGIIEEIKRMQLEGRTEQDIIKSLQEKGYSPQETQEALTQSKIKEAILAPPQEENQMARPVPEVSQSDMQPSMLTPQPSVETSSLPLPQSSSQPPVSPPEYASYDYQAYPSTYADYGYSASSADTIAEISEQVVAEKLQSLKTDIDKIINLKTTFETKIESLNERLSRIEKIIDRLQLSILQKVGEHILNVEDLKKEVIETQKTFKSLIQQSQTKNQKATYSNSPQEA